MNDDWMPLVYIVGILIGFALAIVIMLAGAYFFAP
jgi:hypothetical protein